MPTPMGTQTAGKATFRDAPLLEKNRIRHAFVFVALLALLVVPLLGTPWLAAAQQPAPETATPLEFKVGIADPSSAVLALYMARSAGLDIAQGLNVKIIDMNGGSRGAEELQA